MNKTAYLIRSQKGATIIEVIIALALASIILGSIVALAANSLASSTESKLRTQSTHYTEEGIEIVRALRDSQGFNTFYSSYANGNTYYIQSDSNQGYSLTTTSGNDYLTSINLNPPFSRTVVITDPGSAGNRVLVEVKVSWISRGHSDSVIEDTYLSQWAYD